jgi:hypothetical protein
MRGLIYSLSCWLFSGLAFNGCGCYTLVGNKLTRISSDVKIRSILSIFSPFDSSQEVWAGLFFYRGWQYADRANN